jgi:hypothetical protein
MKTPPPRDPVICPIHNDVTDEPMTFIHTWDGRDWYECSVPRCSCAIDYPAATTSAADPLHSEDPADWTDPEI